MAIKTTLRDLDTTVDPKTGMQADYLVLNDDDRNREKVRPVHDTYVHKVCGKVTAIHIKIAETFARSPLFYDHTYCFGCKDHLAVGKHGEFYWPDGTKVGT